MNTKILDQLEFNKVKDQFTEYLQTEQAQAELRDLVPMTNPERIQNQFTEIQEMAEKDAQGIADYFHLLKDSHKAARATIKKNIKITTVKDPKGKDNTYQTRSYQLSVNQ